MYEYQSAIAISRTQKGRWLPVDIANVQMSQLYNTYEKLLVTLTNSFSGSQKYTFDIESVRLQYVSSTLTFQQFLVENGNNTLETESKAYRTVTNYCRYEDAFRAGYKITPVDENGHIDSPIPFTDRDWLALQRDNVDYLKMQRNCLISINGLYHLTDTDGSKLYVIDGAKSNRKANNNKIGITSFMNVSSFRLKPITQDMVHRRYPDCPMSNKTYLDVGEDLSGKTVGIVIGGYLNLLDKNTFYRISDRIFCIDFLNYPILERYYESRNRIDLTSLDLELVETNEWLVNKTNLTSDEVLIKYLTLPQSFLVIFDNQYMFSDRQYIPGSKIAGKTICYHEPIRPIISGYGLCVNYWKIKEKQRWSISSTDLLMENYQFNTTPIFNINNVTDSKVPMERYDIGRSYFQLIGTDVLVEQGE